MSDCCENHDKHKGEKPKEGGTEKLPKSFIGKYLYNLGKKDVEKKKQSGKHKDDCC